MAYLPYVAGVPNDATKLQLRPSWTPHRDVTGESVWELIHQPVLTEDFADLSAWTEVDAGGLVNLSGGIVSMNGNGSDNANGIWYTAGLALAEGVLEWKIKGTYTALADFLGISASAGLEATAAGAVFRRFGAYALWAQAYSGNLQAGTGQITSATDWITMRVYLLRNLAGLIRRVRMTAEGGTGNDAFPTETVIAEGAVTAAFLGATFYPMFQRVTANAELDEIKEVRWRSGFSTAGEPLVYTHDAGAGKVFDGLDFTNFAWPGALVGTSLLVDWSFDDGVAAYQGAGHTVGVGTGTLNAHGAQAGRHRYIRIKVQVNSDGATQQYAAEPNAADAIAGAGDFPEVGNVAPDDTVQGTAGTIDLPAIASVDPLDTLRGAPGEMDVPTLANIRTTDTLRGAPGTCTVPAAGQLLKGVQVGAAGTEVTGTLQPRALVSESIEEV